MMHREIIDFVFGIGWKIEMHFMDKIYRFLIVKELFLSSYNTTNEMH